MTQKQKNVHDLNATQDPSWAIHLPALSGFYVQQMNKLYDDPNYYGEGRLGEKFESSHHGLDFYNNENGYFHYKYGLYSAGHAKLDIDKHKSQERMVSQRSKGTLKILDSGGFQIAKGTGHFKNINWDEFRTSAGDHIRQKVLEWLEYNGDWSMTLDIPGFASEPPLNKRTGLYSFKDTLDISILNLDYFMKHRTPGAVKFLNVLSGTNINNSKEWYDSVSKYSDKSKVLEMGYTEDRTLEGYAFAGINMKHMPSVLSRFADLIRDNLLHDKDWIHFLGIGRLDWACYLTSIQREVRKHYNPNISISFDCASAFLATAKGLIYNHPMYTPKRFGYFMKKCIDNRLLKGSNTPMPFNSPISNRMTLGDICRLGPGEPNKLGKVANTSWDNCSYLLAMAHNVYVHINAIQEANRLVDYESTMFNLNYRDWNKSKRNAPDITEYVPTELLYFRSFVEEYFNPSKTHDERITMINDNYSFLEDISFGGTKANVFNDLFGDDTDETASEEDFSDVEEFFDIDS
jgi:hypothetical protein